MALSRFERRQVRGYTSLQDAVEKLLTWAPGNVPVAESLQAVVSCIALPAAIKSVDEDIAAKTLLGKLFAIKITQ